KDRLLTSLMSSQRQDK
ncbi:hypothetical protein, partial [Escherichia coli]